MTDPRTIIERELAISRLSTDRPRRPMPGAEKEAGRSIIGRLFRRRDEQIRHTMPWLVASGAIVPGSIYGRRK